MTKRDTAADMEHWAQVAEQVSGRWVRVLEQFARDGRSPSDQIEPVVLLYEDFVLLTEIVADLARQQASTYKSLKAAHDAIGE